MKNELIKERIAAAIDRMGRYQILIIVLMNLNNMTVGINHTLTSILTYTPKFFCYDETVDESLRNGTFTSNLNTNCLGANSTNCVFDPKDSHTIVTEFGLICGRRFLAPLTSSCYFIGVTFGALICGFLSDKFGRKKSIIICVIFEVIFGFSIYFTPNVYVFMALRVGHGFFVQGLQTITYTLVVEYTPVRYRNFIACFWPCYFGIGLIYLGGVSMQVPDWRDLQLFLQIPIIIPFFVCWFVVESPYWSLSKNLTDQAIQNYRKIAKLNNDDEFLATEDLNHQQQMELIGSKEKMKEPQKLPPAPFSNAELFKNPILRKHLLSMISIWFTASLSYYGILFFLPNLPGNRHLNFIYGALIEISGYFVEFFLFTKFGRKMPMIFYQMLNGSICLAIAAMSFYQNAGYSAIDALIVAGALFGKGLAVSLFCGMNIYTVELFPTVCRGTAIGICGFSARIGSLLAPQLLILSEVVHPWLPMAVIGGALCAAGTTLFLLPETKTIQIPNTVQDANRLWAKKL